MSEVVGGKNDYIITVDGPTNQIHFLKNGGWF